MRGDNPIVKQPAVVTGRSARPAGNRDGLAVVALRPGTMILSDKR
jgi:hypothetical protein